MFQTNSAGSILAGPTRGKGPANNAAHGEDHAAFSQEFEKQVKKSGETERGEHAREAGMARAEHAEEAATKAPADESPAGEASAGQAAEEAVTAKAGEAETLESGKNLPQELAALADAEAETTREASEGELQRPGEPLLPDVATRREAILRMLNEGESATDDTQVTMVPLAGAPATGDVADRGAADEGGDFPSLRLRDVVAQRMLAADPQQGAGDAAAGQKGKLDLSALLAMQTGQSRAAGGFDEALKFSSPTGMIPTAASQPAAANVPVAMTLAVPLQQQGWDQAMGERVVWMARSNIQQAQIQLNPRELGPIEIKISIQNDQANVNFVAHHATTREALEAAMPRLRDMLSQQGLELGQADVSQHSFGDSGKQASGTHSGGSPAGQPGTATDEEMAEDTLLQQVSRVSASGVDYFA